MRPSSSSPSADRRDPRAGFSLIEILAAVVLTLFLVAAVMPFASTVLARWMTGQRQLEQADLWMRATVRLVDDAARAVTVLVPGGEQPRVFFRGGDREMVFVRPPLATTSRVPLEQVAYTIERSDDGEALVRRSRPFDPTGLGLPAQDYAASTTIASGPYRFRFTHVSAKGVREPEWRETNTMPRLVELTVEATGSRAAPPAAIAMPFIAAHPADTGPKRDTRPGAQGGPGTPQDRGTPGTGAAGGG